MANQQLIVVVFILGFGAGIFSSHLHSLTQVFVPTGVYENAPRNSPLCREVNLDPFPLPSCAPNRTSAVYVFYGRPVGSHEGNTLFNSIGTLLKSNFPGRVRVVIDQKVNNTIRKEIKPIYKDLLDKIDLHVLDLPDLNGKELIPHSNKIRALQSGALIYGTDSNECTVSLDSDTYIHPTAPWNELLSILQLHDIAVSHDCEVPIAGVPDFLRMFMPNTGVLALRNTPRVRMILRDWLDHFVPCNATHVSTCTPGTDQYPFLQLTVKYAARLHKLDNSWNCRLTPTQIDAGIEDFPVHSLTVLSNRQDPNADDASIVTTCAGAQKCHILHGHWLKFPSKK